jgi:AbrB family looped-hinge helix DNA binding protein
MWHTWVYMATNVTVGPQGRIVIPAELRKELGITRGEKLVARAQDGQLILERQQAILERIQRLFDHIPRDVSLVDELIAERRAQAQRENEEA